MRVQSSALIRGVAIPAEIGPGLSGECSRAIPGCCFPQCEVTPITYCSGLGNRASVRVRFYGYVYG